MPLPWYKSRSYLSRNSKEVYEYRISSLLTILTNTCGADSSLAFEITNHPQLTTIDYNSNKEEEPERRSIFGKALAPTNWYY